MTKHSFLVPFAPHRPEQTLRYAALAQWSDVPRLWQGQAMLNDPFHDFAFAAASGFRVPAGIGVTLMPFRHPWQAALQARSLALSTGQSVVAGFGPGAKSLQHSMLGAPYASQLGAVREYVTIVRALLEQGEIEHTGEHFACHAELPLLPRPRVEVGLGVLRPAMARLAGEVADVAITWLTPAAYLRNVLVPALHEGAATADRTPPRVVAIIPVALARTEWDPLDLVLASSSGHLRLPHYRDMLAQAGVPLDRDDPRACAQALVDGGAFLSGELAAVVERLEDFAAAGVDDIVLNVTGVHLRGGDRAALADIETLLAAGNA